jgi:magnesium transporter
MTQLDSPSRVTDVLSTAVAHASTNVPVADPGQSVEQVLAGLRGHLFDSVAVIAVCQDGILVGLVTMEQLIAASPDAPITEVMDPQPPTVAPDTDQEHAAWQAVHHGEAALAVTDPAKRFCGLVPPRRLLAVLLAEHDEDMAHLGGFLGSAVAARSAAMEGLTRRLWHRLPWLLVGLAGALLAAVIVGSFQRQLEEQVLIAFFIPGVVYLADAVGTQTEALIIRGLSVGVGISRVALREAVTGVLLGALFAAVSYPVVFLIWQEPRVAAAVSIALFAASSIATLIAMALPWTLQRLGGDPAFGSGPLATVIQDLLSITIYFVTASAIAT